MPAPIDPTIRLLSPERRRIYPNPKTGTYLPRPPGPGSKFANSTLDQREGLKPGQPDDITWDCLVKIGWTEYLGAAEVTDQGYIKKSPDGRAIGDPSVVPNPWPTPRQGRAR